MSDTPPAEQPTKSTAEKITEMKAEKARLDRLEATTGNSGAIPLASKQTLLASTPEELADKEKRYRWVNVSIPEKAEERQRNGYVRVPVAEGGRQVGNLARFAVPRQVYEERVKEQERINKSRLTAHQTEVQNIAEAVAKELRDNYGISKRTEDILIKE